MDDPGQAAADRIWKAIVDKGGPQAVSDLTKPAKTRLVPDPEPLVSTSMLYKFKARNKQLGRESVNALAPILTDIDAQTWLAAMGVDAVHAEATA